MTQPYCAARLRAVIDECEPLLLALKDSETMRRPGQGKWSPREIIGHLIDSASNNHQRFVRAAWQEDLIFPGYEQDAWVALQDYQEAPWNEIVGLWAAFNRHIGTVMAAIPDAERVRSRPRHNLHQIAWRPVPESEPATLDYFMNDYVGHLEHHLSQVLGSSWGRESASHGIRASNADDRWPT